MLKEINILTIHYPLIDIVLDYTLVYREWKENGEDYESFSLIDVNGVVPVKVESWSYCPIVKEMFYSIDRFHEI